mmetsp:Transcript_16096/g.46011  ORF Transcript_16096/g.46011 Transcript_16096/m.46011 type:complete len:261 (-) Transcript_16096:601-1383(-)
MRAEVGMHRQQQPSNRGHAAFFVLRDLALPQPQLHAPGDRHKRGDRRMGCTGFKSSADALEPLDMLQRARLVDGQVYGDGSACKAPVDMQKGDPGVKDADCQRPWDNAVLSSLRVELFVDPLQHLQVVTSLDVGRLRLAGGVRRVVPSEANHVHVAARGLNAHGSAAHQLEAAEVCFAQCFAASILHHGHKLLLELAYLLHVLIHGLQQPLKESLAGDVRMRCQAAHFLGVGCHTCLSWISVVDNGSRPCWVVHHALGSR